MLTFEGETLVATDGQTVLEALLEAGLSPSFSCQTGSCQTCMLRAVSGVPDEKAQRGLKDSLKAQGYFLACQQGCDSTLEMVSPDAAATRLEALVSSHQKVTADIVQLRLQVPEQFRYIPGQYLTLWKDEHEGRPYSIASVPCLDEGELELHIKCIEGGLISNWIYHDLAVGDRIQIQDPVGHCCYVDTYSDAKLLLAGSGTGLAPLYGIARDALLQDHQQEIHLFHSAGSTERLYKHASLTGLARDHANFHYHPCVRQTTGITDDGIQEGELTDIVLDFITEPADWRIYLCGAPEMVRKLQKQLFLAGASMKHIHADSFVQKSSQGK